MVMGLTHNKPKTIPPDAKVHKPTLDELAKGMTIYLPIKMRGKEAQVLKYRPARIRRISPPVMAVTWLDEKSTDQDTLHINEFVLPDGPDVEVKRPSRPPEAPAPNHEEYYKAHFNRVSSDPFEELNVPKPAARPGQIRSVAPITGIPRAQQENNTTDRSLVALTADDFSVKEKLPTAKTAVETFDEWIDMGSKLVYPDIQRELDAINEKLAASEEKLASIDKQYTDQLKELEEEMRKVKEAHAEDRQRAEGMVRQWKASKNRLAKRQRLLEELKNMDNEEV